MKIPSTVSHKSAVSASAEHGGLAASLLDLSWPQIAALDTDRSFVFVTVAPIEEHGRHLPVGVDIMLGEHWRKLAVSSLRRKYPDYNFLHMPVLPLAAGSMRGFPGCFYIGAKTLRKNITSVLFALASWGLKNIIVIASHGDPFHLVAIEKACATVNTKRGTMAISPLGAMFSSEELKIDLAQTQRVNSMLAEKPNDFHAGWIETSMMMDIDPSLSGDNTQCPDVSVTQNDMIFPSRYSAATAGQGHLGYPRLANKELGRDLNESSAAYLVQVVETMIRGEPVGKFSHHFLYRMPFFRMLA